MESKIILPKSVCDDEVIGYIAHRYSSTPAGIISRYLQQEGIIAANKSEDYGECYLEDNEMAILRDLGLRPSSVELVNSQEVESGIFNLSSRIPCQIDK